MACGGVSMSRCGSGATEMARALAEGAIEGFCAGEPWGSHAVAQGAGQFALATGDIWPDHPEKVLAFAEDLVAREEDAAIAVTAALIEAQRWLDEPANHAAAVALLSERVFPLIAPDTIAAAFAGGISAPEAAGSSAWPSPFTSIPPRHRTPIRRLAGSPRCAGGDTCPPVRSRPRLAPPSVPTSGSAPPRCVLPPSRDRSPSHDRILADAPPGNRRHRGASRRRTRRGATRDNLVLGGERGGIDGAHILTPMPYLIHTGRVVQNSQPVPIAILARLNVNGQGISVAKKHQPLGARLDASPLRPVVNADSKFAMTFRGGTHDLWIRYWLAAAGIDPDKDVQTIVVPPPQMVANMRVGTMDAFCVGEPWNAQFINQNLGYSVLVTGELWKNHPEKSFALRADFVERNPNATLALTAAAIEAARWCDAPVNHAELAQILGRRAWFNVPPTDIQERIRGIIDYGDGRKVENPDIAMKLWRDDASYPFRSHDLWFLTEDIRWGVLPEGTDTTGLIGQVNREDIWRAAAARAGVPNAEVPSGTSP
jgi:nitrate/nitrite transport system substrate-binding protein